MRRANGADEFYSRSFGARGDVVESFVDRHGNPTVGYPHVHVVHQRNGEVHVTASVAPGRHSWAVQLKSPTGAQVEQAVRDARAHL